MNEPLQRFNCDMYPPPSAILPPPTSLAPIVAAESEKEEPLA